jgi:hypothetical protein
MALWGNKDLVYNEGTVQVNLGTSTAQVTGTAGVVTFTTSGISTGDVITVGAGATYGYAIITGFTSTTISIASTAGFVSGLSTVPSTTYAISQEPLYVLGDSHYRAPESKTVGFSTSPVFTGVFGVDELRLVLQQELQLVVKKLHMQWHTLVGLVLQLTLTVTENSELSLKY